MKAHLRVFSDKFYRQFDSYLDEETERHFKGWFVPPSKREKEIYKDRIKVNFILKWMGEEVKNPHFQFHILFQKPEYSIVVCDYKRKYNVVYYKKKWTKIENIPQCFSYTIVDGDKILEDI